MIDGDGNGHGGDGGGFMPTEDDFYHHIFHDRRLEGRRLAPMTPMTRSVAGHMADDPLMHFTFMHDQYTTEFHPEESGPRYFPEPPRYPERRSPDVSWS